MAEGVNGDTIANRDARPEDYMGFHHHVAAQLGVMAEPDGFRGDQRGAICHRLQAAAVLPIAFDGGEFDPAVDPGDFPCGGFDHRRGTAIGQRDHHNVGEIIFLRRIVIADPRQQRPQILGAHRHQPGIAQTAGAFRFARILVLHHLGNPAVFHNHPPILQRIVGFKSQHHHGRIIRPMQPLNHPGHGLAAHKRHIAI